MTTQTVQRTITAFLGGEDSLEIGNIIHSTEGAARYGYTGPLVGGTTVYSWSVSALVEVLGDDWLSEGWVEFQLRKPVYPEEVITTRVTSNGGDVEFTMTKHTGEIAVQGTAGLGIADFLTEISTVTDRTPVPERAERPFIHRAVAPLGEDLPAMEIPMSAEDAGNYADQLARDWDPRWHGTNCRIHPGWIAQRANALLAHTWRYTAIHASSQIQHLAPVKSDQTLLVSGRLDSGYERKGHEYAVIDVSIAADDGRELVRLRQPTIYQVGER
jgi:hypothetical protein